MGAGACPIWFLIGKRSRTFPPTSSAYASPLSRTSLNSIPNGTYLPPSPPLPLSLLPPPSPPLPLPPPSPPSSLPFSPPPLPPSPASGVGDDVYCYNTLMRYCQLLNYIRLMDVDFTPV